MTANPWFSTSSHLGCRSLSSQTLRQLDSLTGDAQERVTFAAEASLAPQDLEKVTDHLDSCNSRKLWQPPKQVAP